MVQLILVFILALLAGASSVGEAKSDLPRALTLEEWAAPRKLLETSALGRNVVETITGNSIYPGGIELYRHADDRAVDGGHMDGWIAFYRGRYVVVLSAETSDQRATHVLGHEVFHIHDFILLDRLLKPSVLFQFRELLRKGLSSESRQQLSTEEGIHRFDPVKLKLIALTHYLLFVTEFRAHSYQLGLYDEGLTGNYQAQFIGQIRSHLRDQIQEHYIKPLLIPLMDDKALLEFSRTIPLDQPGFESYAEGLIRRIYPEALNDCETGLRRRQIPRHP